MKRPYAAAHRSIVAARGKAALHPCEHCDTDSADAWAYAHKRAPVDRRQFANAASLPYSFCVDDYMPLCKNCHQHYDHPPRYRNVVTYAGYWEAMYEGWYIYLGHPGLSQDPKTWPLWGHP